MSSINKLIANVKKTSSLTSSFINNDSSYICIDTSANRIGFNTQNPNYSIHIVDNNGIICVSNILLSNLSCDVSGYIKDLSCINFDVSCLKVDTSFILTATQCTISCEAIDFCNSKLNVHDLSVNNDLSVNKLKYKTLEKITVDGGSPDEFDKVEINDCSINENLDISGTFTFHMQSDKITRSEFNCFNAETSFNLIRTQNITCDYEISCNDICCNDISCNFIKVINEISCNNIRCDFLTNLNTLETTDISCTEISCNTISCNDICANNLYIYNDISCNNKIITSNLEITRSLIATGDNITLEGVNLKDCNISDNLFGLLNSTIDISRSQLILPDISYVNDLTTGLTTGSIYFDSSLQSIKVIHNSDETSDQSYNIFYNKKFVNVELSYNNIIPNNGVVINNINNYQNIIDTLYTDFNKFGDDDTYKIRDQYVSEFISTNTDTDISYLNIPLDISYNKANVDPKKFYDISDATILGKDVDRIKIIYNDFVDDTTQSSSNTQLFKDKNIFFNINAYVTLKYFNQYPNDVEVISYDFEMMNTTGAIEGDILTKSKNTIISFDNSYNYSTSNLNYVGKLKNGSVDINSYIYFRIKTENNKDISNLLLYDFNCSVVQI